MEEVSPIERGHATGKECRTQFKQQNEVFYLNKELIANEIHRRESLLESELSSTALSMIVPAQSNLRSLTV